MDDKKRLVLKICVRCNYLKFGDVEYDGGFDGIEDLVENSEIEAFFCEDCVMFVKKYAKQVLREVYQETECVGEKLKKNKLRIVKNTS